MLQLSLRNFSFVFAAATVTIGCVGHITVVVPPHQAESGSALGAAPPTRVSVKVLPAVGATAGGRREAAFGVPMGDVSFSPGAVESVQRALESELEEAGHRIVDDSPQVAFVAHVKHFGVRTNTTPLYWDVIAQVAVELAPIFGQYDAECVDRTYVYPGKSLIAALMSDCLANVGKQFARDAEVTGALNAAHGE